jgi:hypothetical protein
LLLNLKIPLRENLLGGEWFVPPDCDQKAKLSQPGIPQLTPSFDDQHNNSLSTFCQAIF